LNSRKLLNGSVRLELRQLEGRNIKAAY